MRPEQHLDATRKLLGMHHRCKVGHLGGNLSCLDALLVLFGDIAKAEDRVILSKGHSAGALYVALNAVGVISDLELETFHQDGTRLPAHPPARVFEQIPFATGSLGHGLSLAAGFALSRKLRQAPGRAFCLCSDGEWQEGSTWEALIFACRHRLNNLTILVDHNGFQGFGDVKTVAAMDPLWERLRGFPVDIRILDGHDPAAMQAELEKPSDSIRILMLRTVKGRFLPGLENTMESHYLPPNDAQYQGALRALEAK